MPGQRIANAVQPGGGIVGHLENLRVAGQDDHQLRVEETDGHLPVDVSPHDHVARQQRTDVGLDLQGSVGERRIAGAKNPVERQVDAEFFFHRTGHIDIAQHAETLGLERGQHSRSEPKLM